MSKQIQKHIQQLFKIDEFLGSGAYGHVWRVIQKSNDKKYALKKIFDAFQNDIDSQRTYRQITILHQLKHPQIIQLKGVIKSKNQNDLYLLFQNMETDLHSLVGQNILETTHLLYIIYQIFKALKYIHSAHLLHRDLKPSNILINSECQIKLCDFGLVRSMTREQNTPLILTQDVATRWYRSPEMLLGSQNYDPATDIWSVGCILAQLLIGEPILMGDSNIHQLEKILQLTGIPKNQDIALLDSPAAFPLIKEMKIIKKPFVEYMKNSKYFQQKQLLELVKRMLEFNPSKRITVDQVLNHHLLSDLRCKKEEILCQKIIIPELDDNIRLGTQEYRKAIYKNIQRRYPQYNPPTISKIKIQRAHNSLMDRKNPISLNSRKVYNSVLRPIRKGDSFFTNHQLLIRPINKPNQFKSLHQDNQVNNRLNKQFNSVHQSNQNIIQKKSFNNKNNDLFKENQNRLSIQKNPFRKYRKQNQKKAIQLSELKVIYGLRNEKKNCGQKQNIKSPQRILNRGISSPYHLMPYGNRKQQKNISTLLNKQNNQQNKIYRKALNRQKKQFYKNRRNKLYQNNINNNQQLIQQYIIY